MTEIDRIKDKIKSDKMEEIKMYNTVTLSVLIYGATIVEIKINGKKWFCITAGKKMDNINKEDIYKLASLKRFPTIKGALGYCRRRKIQVNEISSRADLTINL